MTFVNIGTAFQPILKIREGEEEEDKEEEQENNKIQ